MAKYNKEIVNRICDLIGSDSYTVSEVCKMTGISESTYHEWKAKKPEFAEFIKKAQNKFDELILSEAKKSLVKMIKGYTVQERHTTTADTGKKDSSGKPIVRVKEYKVVEKNIQPVPAAVIFALCNLDPDNWKNRQDNKTELTGKGGSPLMPPISRDAARKIIEAL